MKQLDCWGGPIHSGCQTKPVDACVTSKSAMRKKGMSDLRRLGLLNKAGMRSLNEGKMNDAMFQLVQASRIARQMNTPLHEAKVRNNIGLVHLLSQEYDQARIAFLMAEKLAIKGAGEGNVLHRSILRNLDRLDQTTEEVA